MSKKTIVVVALLGILFPAFASAQEKFTVKRNQSLWKISKIISGKGSRWVELAAANAPKVQPPRFIIHPGQELTVPLSLLSDPNQPQTEAPKPVVRLAPKLEVQPLAKVIVGDPTFKLGYSSMASALMASHAPPILHDVAPEQVLYEQPMLLTAYCPCDKCSGYWKKFQEGKREILRLIRPADGITATGDNAYIADGVAADFGLLKKRTRLSIPGVGIREVDDTGGDMRDAASRGEWHIDVRFPTHWQALRFGVQRKLVKVLRQ